MRVGGVDVLVDFERSILDWRELELTDLATPVKRIEARSVLGRLRRLLFGENQTTRRNEQRFIELLTQRSLTASCLVVGGGAVGSGMHKLYGRADIDVIGLDIYRSELITFVADAHRIPLAAASVDGVWIQAVLEHVLDPWQVVQELHRVLKRNGVIYAETPFLQQVHEGAYDFTRFTHSGHRWLFRAFEEIDSGIVGGPGVQALWTIDAVVRSLTRSRLAGRVARVLSFPLRFLDRLCGSAFDDDTASGFFFLGRRADEPLHPRAMLEYYERRRASARS